MHIFNGCTSRAHCKLDLIFINYKAEEVNTKIGLSPNMLDKKNHRGNRRREKEREILRKKQLHLNQKKLCAIVNLW